MSKQNKLSVCIITNNDENYIANSLPQYKDIADEIIIADIGSTDHTVDIARKEGAQVYQIDWHNDFSEVRNFLMEHARCKWVWFMQANEIIAEKHIAQIPSLLDNPNAEGYMMLIDYNSENYLISSPVQTLRLVRNHTENRYRYRSFECIPDELMTGVVNSKVEIKQQCDAMLSWEMNLRLMLLEEELSTFPQDSYLQYMSGIVQLNRESIEECIKCFEGSHANINTGYLYAPHLWKCLSWAYVYLEQYDHAVQVLSEGIALYPFYTDLLILRAEAFKQLNQYENAIGDMEQCIKLRGIPTPSVPNAEISDSYAFTIWGEIYELMLDSSKALLWYIQAYRLDSTDAELLMKIGELMGTVGSEETADELICIALEQKDQGILRNLLIMLRRRHAFSSVLTHLDMIRGILGIEETRIIEVFCRLFIEDIQDIQLDKCELDLVFCYIESCWMRNCCSIAENVLLRLRECGLPGETVDLYMHIQKLLTHKEKEHILLEPETYVIAKAIQDDFLWKDQAGKAKLMLPMLLCNQTDERCLQLAMPWTRIGGVNEIQLIYSNLSCGETRNEFITKAITELLRWDYPYEAEKIGQFGGLPLPKELERVLWASCLTQKLKERLKELESTKSVSRSENEMDIPDNGLTQYYRQLCRLNGSTPAEELTAAQTHEAIGDLYMKRNKKSEAFYAYLVALQKDSWKLELQQKVILRITEDPALNAILNKFDRFSPNGWFAENNGFKNFVFGLKYYYEESFQQATALFSQTINNPEASLICRSYAISIPLLEKRMNELRQTDHFNLDYYEVCACINFILCYIQKPLLYCGDLIRLLEEKIRKLRPELLA